MKKFGKIKNVHVMMALFAVLLVSMGYMSMQFREGLKKAPAPAKNISLSSGPTNRSTAGPPTI